MVLTFENKALPTTPRQYILLMNSFPFLPYSIPLLPIRYFPPSLDTLFLLIWVLSAPI
jgi:hypothetical protein